MTKTENACFHWGYKPTQMNGYLEVLDEAVYVRVEDDHYDGLLTKEQAIELARAILRRYCD